MICTVHCVHIPSTRIFTSCQFWPIKGKKSPFRHFFPSTKTNIFLADKGFVPPPILICGYTSKNEYTHKNETYVHVKRHKVIIW